MIGHDQIKRDLKNIGLDDDKVNKITKFIIEGQINMDSDIYYDYLFELRLRHYKNTNIRAASLGIAIAFLIILALSILL